MRLPLAAPLALLLFLLCVALGYRIERQLTRSAPDADLPEIELAAAPATLRPAESAAQAPAADLAAIEARPLFAPDRRPWRAAADEAGPPALGLRLAGTVISDGERIAILYAEGAQEPQRLRVGDTIAGWTLQSIEPNRIVLLLDDQRRELLLGAAP